jgi:hypothetical protein
MKAVGLSPGDTSAPTGVEREAGHCYSNGARGTASVVLGQPASGPVGGITPATDPIKETVAALFAPSGCTIAGFAALVYVWAEATAGWSRCSKYDAQAVVASVPAI